MKLFSRKALVAAATAATVSLSGVTVATAETPDTGSSIVNAESSTGSQNNDNAPDGEETPDGEDNDKDKDKDNPANGGSSLSNLDPRAIRDWIAVFTAIISALGTVFAFYNKNFVK